MRDDDIGALNLQKPAQFLRARKSGKRIFGFYVDFGDAPAVGDDALVKPPADGNDEIVVTGGDKNTVHLHDAAFDAALIHGGNQLNDLQMRSSTPLKWTLSS
jgi:hypothetical protein